MNPNDPAPIDPTPPALEPPGVAGPHRRSRRPAWTVRTIAIVLGAIYLVPVAIDALHVLPEGVRAEEWVFLRFSHDRPKVWEGEVWRILTSTMLHAGVLHLGLNLFGLVCLGSILERWMGGRRFVAVYFLCALAGGLAFQALSRGAQGVGASGAVMGIAGVILAAALGVAGPQGPRYGRRFWWVLSTAFVLLFAEAAVIEFIYSAMGMPGIQVAVSAHLGGFVCGLLLGYLARLPHGRPATLRRLVAGNAVAAQLLLSAYFGLVSPVADWGWHVFQAERRLESGDVPAAESELRRAREMGGDPAAAAALVALVEHGEVERALDSWRRQPFDNPEIQRDVGYRVIYDALRAQGFDDASDAVLDELIALSDRAIATRRDAELLNEASWLRAMRGRDLETALVYAQEAFSLQPDGQIQNTLGWVQFLLGDYGPAFQNLTDAAERLPIGPNFLYLALAYQDVDKSRAREYAELAHRKGHLLGHEKRFLEEVWAALRAG